VTPNPKVTGPRSGPGSAGAPDCSIIIVNYHSEALLRACLESLPSSAHPVSFEVIVVDNSGTALRSGALDALPGVRLLDAGGNVGFAHACNLGMAAARGRHLLLLNPDTVAHPGAVATLSRYLDGSPAAGVVAARLLNPDGTLQYSCRRFPRPLSILFGRYALLTRLFPGNPVSRDYLYLDWDHASAREVDWVSGACLMVRRDVVDRVGGLDDRYFLFVEDMDWCRRIRDAGLDVVYVAEAEVTHRIGASRGPVPSWVMWERHLSMLRYVRKHFGWPRALVTLVAAGLALRSGLLILQEHLRGRWLASEAASTRPRALADAASDDAVERPSPSPPVPVPMRLPPA
jgi:GT2 family glycosyltransferase